MDSFQTPQNEDGYTIPPIMNPPTQIFGDYGSGSPLSADFPTNYLPDDPNAIGDDSNDPKRRRIARVTYPVLRGGSSN